MEGKKRKIRFLDKAATFTLVAMLIVVWVGMFVGTSGEKIKVRADESAYVGPQAFDIVPGSTTSFDIEPGRPTRVRTLVNGYKPDAADGVSSFTSFTIDSSDSRITTSDLKLLDSTLPIFPNPNEASGSYYPEFPVNNAFQMTIDFLLNSAEDLPAGEYELTLYGIKMRNKNGNYVDMPQTSDSSLVPVKIPILKYTIKNAVPQRKGEIRIEKVNLENSGLEPGGSNTLVVRVMNSGKADISDVVIDPGFDLKSFLPDYEMKTINIGEVKVGELKTAKIPFSVSSSAEYGLYPITVNVSGKDVYGNSLAGKEESLYVTIGAKGTTPKNAPLLVLSTKQNYKLLKPSTEDSVIIRITNSGERKAKNVRLYCDSGLGIESGLTKNFTTSYIKVDDIPAGEMVKVEVPFTVGAGFTKGIHELKFSASYSDEEKNPYESEKMTMYVEHYKTGDMESVDGITYLQISGVSQSPSSPSAGDKVTVSFTVKNKGSEKISNLQFYGTGLSAAGFQPVSGEPYQNEGSLDAGEKKKVTMTFRAGESIPKGVNALTIGYDYFDASNKLNTSTTTIYVLNVINHKFDEIDVGRPKIIVSDYTTEPEILRAGEVFDFSYTLKNTHTGKEARNIKITLSQIEGVLAPAQGTNIFYIDKLDPTQEVTLSLPLKSRADTVTGDYPIVLKLEYEYDDMSEVDKEHGGVSEENTIKVRVIENYRPVIENIYIDSYQGVMVGQPVDLNFEFYNMGKSTLGNVYITIEGDFTLANNSAMSYVGAVQGYGQEYLAPQVVPLVGGEAHGTVTIHFEDSNGDEQTKSSDFTAWVDDPMGSMGGDFGMGMGTISGPFYGGGWGELPDEFGEFGEGMPGMEGEEEGFFASIPWWGWVIAGVTVVGIVVLVIVLIKKHKKKKDTDEEDNEDI
ncbi:MAG: hypothetical protein K6F93_00465 [Lachnospiraceae bacterium]|nr:hypothetical protein [Lachnospiraceae bacterium]